MLVEAMIGPDGHCAILIKVSGGESLRPVRSVRSGRVLTLIEEDGQRHTVGTLGPKALASLVRHRKVHVVVTRDDGTVPDMFVMPVT